MPDTIAKSGLSDNLTHSFPETYTDSTTGFKTAITVMINIAIYGNNNNGNFHEAPDLTVRQLETLW